MGAAVLGGEAALVRNRCVLCGLTSPRARRGRSQSKFLAKRFERSTETLESSLVAGMPLGLILEPTTGIEPVTSSFAYTSPLYIREG